MQHTSFASVVSQYKLVPDWRLKTEISAALWALRRRTVERLCRLRLHHVKNVYCPRSGQAQASSPLNTSLDQWGQAMDGGQNPALLTVRKTLISANVGLCASSRLQHWRIRSSSSRGQSTPAAAGGGGSLAGCSECQWRSVLISWSSSSQSYGLRPASVSNSQTVTPNDHTSLFVENLPCSTNRTHQNIRRTCWIFRWTGFLSL